MDESAEKQPSFPVDEQEPGMSPWTFIGIIVLPILLVGGFFGYKYGMSQWHIRNGDAAIIKREYQTAASEYDAARTYWDDEVIEEKVRSVQLYIELAAAVKVPTTNVASRDAGTGAGNYQAGAQANAQAATPLQKVIQYTIEYYNISPAEDGKFDMGRYPEKKKQDTVEGALSYMQVSQRYIKEYAIIFSSVFETDGRSSPALMRDGKLVALAGFNSEEEGAVNEYSKTISLKSTIKDEELTAIFSHEFGHTLQHKLSADEFKMFMEARKMPPAVVSSWYTYFQKGQENVAPPIDIGSWTKSPAEDFAESFKAVYGGPKNGEAIWEVKTIYGPVTDEVRQVFDAVVAPKFRN